MKAFIRFNRGLMKMPVYWQAWLMLLVVANAIVPLFFWEQTLARVVVAVFLAGAVLMTILTAVSGFSRLLGLGHVLWIPLLYYLWTQLYQFPAETWMGIWIRGLMILNSISLVIDALDVIRYLRGDRGETVKGL